MKQFFQDFPADMDRCGCCGGFLLIIIFANSGGKMLPFSKRPLSVEICRIRWRNRCARANKAFADRQTSESCRLSMEVGACLT